MNVLQVRSFSFLLNYDMLHQFLFCHSSITESRLFLVGSSLNGFGTRSSDGDLCLVVKEEPVSNLKHTVKTKSAFKMNMLL